MENINQTENAISAVTKILQFNGSAVNLDQVLVLWPIFVHVVEANICWLGFLFLTSIFVDWFSVSVANICP